MRIVFIQKTVGEGGAKKSLLETLRCARDQNDVQCRVITGGEGAFTESCRVLGVTPIIAPLPEWRKWFQRLFFGRSIQVLAKRLGDFSLDYVISNEMWWSPHALHLARKLGCKAGCTVRDLIAAGPKARQYMLHELDRVLCVSAAMQREIDQTGQLPGNTRVVYNTVRSPAISPADGPHVAALLGKFPAVQKWLLAVGAVGPRKNQMEAVLALRKFHDAGFTDWGLLVAGEMDTDYVERLKKAVEIVRLQQHVCLAGNVDYVGNLIQQCEATLLTSQREGLPRSIIESFLLGKPCFSTPLPGLEEIYGREISTFVCRACEGEALAQVALDALKEPDKLRAATMAVQKKVQIDFSPAAHWGQFVDALA